MTMPAIEPKKMPGEPSRGDDNIDDCRMSFGDHLEELRTRLLRALLGLAVGVAISLLFATNLIALLCRPLQAAMQANELHPSLLAMDPAGPFMIYLKMAALSGLVIALPWITHQIWLFVTFGLYPHEKRFVRLFGPISAVLFATGVVFLYLIVLPIVLNFFIRFNQSFQLPDMQQTGLSSLLLGDNKTPEDTAAPQMSVDIAIVAHDPQRPPQAGSIWFNQTTHRLCFQTGDDAEDVFYIPALRQTGTSAVRSEFGLSFYISFVLTLALAFGLAFELPVAVVFLALTGIVAVSTMRKARRYVVFGIFIAAAVLTPPDVISQILLGVPMVVLFEGGLLAATIVERRKTADTA